MMASERITCKIEETGIIPLLVKSIKYLPAGIRESIPSLYLSSLPD